DGTVTIGIDDFAKKLIGRIDDVELPNLGMMVKRGQPLFSVRQGQRAIPFRSPVSGKVIGINSRLREHIETLDITPYERNWVCAVDADELDAEIQDLRIGKAAVSFYQEEISAFRESIRKAVRGGNGSSEEKLTNDLYVGILEHLDDREWGKIVKKFFDRQV
ncbi:MAG: histidine kinase, partial [Proteobacteria bacterium]|nr:histidine kinase [Pseudomonadota bacterium]